MYVFYCVFYWWGRDSSHQRLARLVERHVENGLEDLNGHHNTLLSAVVLLLLALPAARKNNIAVVLRWSAARSAGTCDWRCVLLACGQCRGWFASN
jgi:hypothetical protein